MEKRIRTAIIHPQRTYLSVFTDALCIIQYLEVARAKKAASVAALPFYDPVQIIIPIERGSSFIDKVMYLYLRVVHRMDVLGLASKYICPSLDNTIGR